MNFIPTEQKPDEYSHSSNHRVPVKSIAIIISVLIVALIGLFVVRYFLKPDFDTPFSFHNPFNSEDEVVEIKHFQSAEDFRQYLAVASEISDAIGGFGTAVPMVALESREMVDFGMDMAESQAIGVGSSDKTVNNRPDRVSETNVQVFGIDEPDIVKTNGSEIFASLGYQYDWIDTPRIMVDESGVTSEQILPPTSRQGGVRSIKAWPPVDLTIDSTISEQGDLLLVDDKLLVFSGRTVTAYNVSDPIDPKESWQIKLEDNSSLITSRLYDNELYLVARTRINQPRPCPFEPFSIGNEKISIACDRIYHPVVPIDVDSTYTVTKVNPADGKVMDTVSFIGSQQSSVVYMSTDHLYITYVYPGDIAGFVLDFFIANDDLFDTSITGKLKKLRSYDLSQQTKMSEISYILQRYLQGLDSDEKLRIENEMENRLQDFSKQYMRKLEQTGIVQINNKKLSVDAVGSVPGTLLNQFSMDEYEGYVRIVTTVSSNGSSFGIMPRIDSVNDVYVLDKDMVKVGEVLDLGLTESVYSARFVGDLGYIVTFRQTDPFYVIDLANPHKPYLAGELKIPGYSSYLHPLTDTTVLGIGKEGSKVKLSLFDVSDPKNPREADKYVLDEYWSEVLSTHHAFLVDTEKNVFFMPGSRGGYVFGYQGNTLSLVRAISDIVAKRALYIDNYLYIVGENKLVDLKQSDWERIHELDY